MAAVLKNETTTTTKGNMYENEYEVKKYYKKLLHSCGLAKMMIFWLWYVDLGNRMAK